MALELPKLNLEVAIYFHPCVHPAYLIEDMYDHDTEWIVLWLREEGRSQNSFFNPQEIYSSQSMTN